jgi:hypothetical protein
MGRLDKILGRLKASANFTNVKKKLLNEANKLDKICVQVS